MAGIWGKCSACGAPLKLDVAQPFAEAEIAAAFCRTCTEHQLLDHCAVLTLRGELQGARFALGKVTITAGAVEALADGSQHAVEFLVRHARGDWGEYTTSRGKRLWVITCLDGSGTTVLLPEEY